MSPEYLEANFSAMLWRNFFIKISLCECLWGGILIALIKVLKKAVNPRVCKWRKRAVSIFSDYHECEITNFLKITFPYDGWHHEMCKKSSRRDKK